MRINEDTAALIMASTTFFSIVLIRFAIPSILPYIITKEGVPESMGGLLTSIFWVGYTVFQIIGGLITDRYGFATLTYVLSLACIMTLLYPMSLTHYYYLAILQFGIGSLSAVAYVLLISIVIISYKRSGLGVGIYQSMFFLASSISIILTPLLISNYYIPFFIYSVIILISLILLLISFKHGLVKPRPSSTKLKIGPEKPGFLGIGLLRFSSGFAYLGFLSWSTYYVIKVLHIQFTSSGIYAFTTSILGIAGAVIGGYVGDKVGYIYPSILSSSFLAIILVLLSVVKIPYVIIALLLSLGFLYGFYASPTMATTRFAKNVGTTSGFLNFMSQLGGTLSPYLMGLITQLYGVFVALMIVGLTSLCIVIIGFVLVRIYDFTK